MGKRVKLVVGTRSLHYLHPWSILGLYFVKIWVFGLYFKGQRPLNELGAIFIPKWRSGCLQNCQHRSHSWDVDLEEVPEFLGSPVMAVLLLETSNRASFASLIWEGSASAPCDLHLATEVRMNMNHCCSDSSTVNRTILGWND